MYSSRKYPYSPIGGFLFCTPYLPWNSSLASYVGSKILASKTPLPLGISNNLPWGGFGFITDLHNQCRINHLCTPSLSPQGEGLPLCKNLWSFSLFCHYYVRSIFCFDFFATSLFSLFYVTREGDRFLHRGWAQGEGTFSKMWQTAENINTILYPPPDWLINH